MNKYQKIKRVISKNIKDNNIPFNNKIFIWFLSFFFFNFFFKKKISHNDAAYFDYLFTNNISKDHSLLSDMASRVGWITYKEKSSSSYFNLDLPDNDIPNQQFFSQTRKMQGISDTGSQNMNSDLLQMEQYKNKSTFAQEGSYIPLIYNSNPLEDTQFIEKPSSIYRLHWYNFVFSLFIYVFEIFFLFLLIFFSLDFYIYFDGFSWNIFEISIKYPSRFIWLNLSFGSYSFDVYSYLPCIFKICVLFVWHLWYYSKFLFFLFFFVFVNFIYALFSFTFILIYNIYLKVLNLNTDPPSDGYFGDFSYLDFTENFPEFSNKGNLFKSSDNSSNTDVPVGEVTDLNLGKTEDKELADDFFIFYKDEDSILKMRPTAELFFFFKSFLLIFFFFMWYVILFIFIIFTINYFFFSFFSFFIYHDVYKYTFLNYIIGHVNLFPILDWFYQFEIKMKKIYNQRFFLEKYTNYIFSKGYNKLHYFFIKKKEYNNQNIVEFLKEISKYNKEISFPRRMKSKRYFYRSLTPYISDIDRYFKKGVASKRILFDFVFFKHFTSFQNKIAFLPTKDNVNYYLPNKTRLWIINTRFKDFYTYIYDFITGSFFFSYVEFTNFKFFKIDDLTISRLLKVIPQDENLYNEVSKKTVIYSHYYDIPTSKNNSVLKIQNSKKIVSDIFLEDFNYYGKSKKPEEFYSTNLYNQNKITLIQFFQNYYNYVFFLRNSFKKEHYSNLFRVNFRFEELFESLEHETDLFFDFSKRNLNAADINSYLKFYWEQYTSLRDLKKKKIQTTMKINNFFIRSRLKFLKIFSKFDFVGTTFLYDSAENRKIYESFKYFKIKYLKKFLRFYGLFQFNSNLRKNQYLITNNFYKNYDLIRFRYFKNLELWKIFQFRTPFQHLYSRLNSRSFLGYYCNSNNTFPFVKYRDHFKSHLPSQAHKWIARSYREELKGFPEERFKGTIKQRKSQFRGSLGRKVRPLDYVFYYENDNWRNYRYNAKQHVLDASPKFIASSSFFNSYYFIIKYLPKDTFKTKNKNEFLFNNYFIEFNFFLHILENIKEVFLFIKKKFFFIFFVWQWSFFLFIVYIFNKVSDDFSFKNSKTKYFYKNVKESVFFLNFIFSFIYFLVCSFIFLTLIYVFFKILNYITNDLIFYLYSKLLENFEQYKINKNLKKIEVIKKINIYIYFYIYFLICFFIYLIFFSNFYYTYNSSKSTKKEKSNNFFNVILFDFSFLNVDLGKFTNNQSKIFNSIDQISFFKSYKIKKKKK